MINVMLNTFKALEPRKKAAFWCQHCECSWMADERIEIELPDEQGCEGATTQYLDTCLVCDGDLEPYNYQDRE